ncbi:MAG: hypothetical protein ABSA71_11420 [Desulfomonilia bacterium]|jgi:hypothetical protein
MADQPGRKADLDKDGIILQDVGKAELDKDGIALEIEESPGPAKEEGTTPDKGPEEHSAPKKRLPLMALVGAAGLLVLIAAVGLFLYHGHHKAPQKTVHMIQPQRESPFGPDGMVLDPFMVLYETNTPKKFGVLLAQVSLKIDPSMITTVESKLFDIRGIIYKRLVAAASVYSQTEITLMLSDDLIDYPIQEVAFVQYSAK